MRSPAGEFLKAEMKRAIFKDKADQIVVDEVKFTASKEVVNNTNVKNNNDGTSESSDKFELSADDDFEKPRGDVQKKAKKNKKTDESDKKQKDIKKVKKAADLENEESSEGEAVIISETEWPPRWYKLIVEFDDGTKMAFSDPRRYEYVFKWN